MYKNNLTVGQVWTLYTGDGCGPGLSLKRGSDVVRVYIRNDFIAFVFQGSDDLKDWVSNFRVGEGKEHYGFSLAFKSFQDDIREWVRRAGHSKTIYFIGHSRGGALATLAANFARNIYIETNTPFQ